MLQHEYGVPVVVAYKGEGSEDLLTITTEVDYRRFILYSERQQLVRLTVTEATPENLAYVPAAHVPMAPRGLGKNVLDLKISLGGGSAAEPHARQHQPLRLPIALPAPIHHPPTQAPKQPLLPPPPPPAVRMEQFTGGLTELDVKLLDIVGNGAFGVVHRALRCRDGLDMAVKTMLVDVKPEGQKQILIELHVLHQCHSPFIVGFFGAYFSRDIICICTEWMDCGSLDAVAKAGLAIPEPILGYISFSVLSGLVYLMESLHVMHRDIKPSNILLNSRGNVRLCDFGVSTMLTNSLRHAVTYIGTNAYMAVNDSRNQNFYFNPCCSQPEKITGEEYTILSDVWSLGISLVELAMGKFPFGIIDDASHFRCAHYFSFFGGGGGGGG